MGIRKGGRRAVKNNELLDLALKVCRAGGCVSITDVIAYLPIGKSSFYQKFRTDSDEYKMIVEELERSKRKACVSIRGTLFGMKQNPTAQLAVYKMLCTDEERAAISFTKTDVTTNGKDIASEPIVIEVVDSRDKVEAKE